MTIHGVTRKVSADGTIAVISDGIVGRAKFMLNPEDYDIKIPKVVRKNIANQLEITVALSYQPV
jgi:polyisoprenoid-binding protein YceI